jgi:hypothetical protein
MALLKLQFKPGINRDVTNYSGEGGWWECDKIRFRSGLPEKLGGWIKYSPNYFYGVCRNLFSWVTTFSDLFLAVGTNRKLYIELGSRYNDVTPLRTTFMAPVTSNSISVTNASTTVTVNLLLPHGLTTGDYVTISGVVGATTIADNLGGILLTNINTNVQVTVVNPTSFTFVAANAATSTVPNAGGTAIYIATVVSPYTNNSLSTTNGSRVVLFTLSRAHGALTGDFVTVSGVTGTVGGVPDAEINTNHAVTVLDSLNFTITVATAATSTVSAAGGTTISMTFEIHAGSAGLVYGYGWGVGLWGRNAWGSGANVPIVSPQQDWWFDNFDNDLIANIRGGAPYIWQRGPASDPTSALNTRAITLQAYAAAEGWDADEVPAVVTQLMVSQQDRHLIAFGAVPFGSTDPDDFDPLLIRWADQDTPGDWTPMATNTAGFLRASRGSRIVTALPTRQEILVWTDITLYAMQFLGTTDVFGLQEYAPDVTIAGPRARISASNIVYWMGRSKFYMYSGRVETLDCTLLSHVFDNLNYDQLEQIVAGTNEQWNEIWWFYPSAGSNQNNSYVIYNYIEKIWYYGAMARTAWMDSQLYTRPLASNNEDPEAVTQTGLVYNHEEGVNDDTLPMEAYIQSNDFDLGDGDKFMLSRRLIPDVKFQYSTVAHPEVTFTLQSRNFPGSARRADAQDARPVIQTAVDEFTEQVFIRARARQMSLKVSSDGLGVHWNLGTSRLDVREDGAR